MYFEDLHKIKAKSFEKKESFVREKEGSKKCISLLSLLTKQHEQTVTILRI